MYISQSYVIFIVELMRFISLIISSFCHIFFSHCKYTKHFLRAQNNYFKKSVFLYFILFLSKIKLLLVIS